MGSSHHLSFCACKTAWLASKSLVCIGPSHYLWFLYVKQRLLDQNLKVSMSPRHHLSFCAYNTPWLAPELLVCICPSPILWLCAFKISDFSTRLTSLYGFHPSPVVLCMQNSAFRTRITSFYGSKTSPVDLWMQNSVISIRGTSLYGSQPSSVFFACKQTFGPELHVSMGPWPHLSFCACKTAWLASKLLVCIGPSPHLWFLHAKQRLLDQNYKSL